MPMEYPITKYYLEVKRLCADVSANFVMRIHPIGRYIISLMMRLLLKRGELYSRIFKLTFLKNKKEKYIVGTFSLFEDIKVLLPNAVDVDCHFTYFSSGNYHFSYKYFDTQQELYIDRKLYHNHVRVNGGVTRGQMKLIEGPRNKKLDDPLDMFMMGEPLPNWNVRPIGHTFAVLGMSFTDDSLSKITWLEDVRLDEVQDLILDVDNYPDGQVSFGCSFYSVGNPTHDFSIKKPNIAYCSKDLTEGDLKLSVYAVFIPMN